MATEALALPAPAASWERRAVECALVALAYAAAGKLGLAFAVVNESVTAVWPPTGIALAAVLLLGPRVWPGILAGAFLVNITTSGSVFASTAIAAGNTLEPLAGGWLLGRFAEGRRCLERPAGVFLFALLAGAAAPVIGATWGAASLRASGLAQGPLWPVWLTWWLGDGAGALVVAPAFLLWGAGPAGPGARPGPLELAAAAAALAAAAGTAFWGRLPLGFLCMPPLLWVAFRFGRREASWACLALCAFAVTATVNGRGSFARPNVNESLLMLQCFVAVSTVVALVVAAAVEEGREAQATLRRARDELEARVVERTADLKRSNEDLEAFAALAAHELQEPVRKLQMFGDLLKPGAGAAPSEIPEFVERMQDAARRMGRLVQDMLTLARARNLTRPLEEVALEPVAREAAEEYAPPASLDGGAIELGDLPTLRGDPGQLRQLFGNLFSNAVKFRRKGVPARIVVSCRPARPGFVDIEVSDNGIGFDEQYSRRIFEPFQRLHRRTDYEGSGLGLALCARIAARHGGSVAARSVPGEGSVFTVSLPTGNGGG